MIHLCIALALFGCAAFNTPAAFTFGSDKRRGVASLIFFACVLGGIAQYLAWRGH